MMAIGRIHLENVTVFESLDLELSPGLNVFIGENGMGKTHVMKLIYSACKAVRQDVSFPQKVVKVFLPEGYNIRRLVSRSNHGDTAKVIVCSDNAQIGMKFTTKTPRWSAAVIHEDLWESQLADLSCTFIPAKEILSNGWHFEAAVSTNNVEFDDTYADVVAAAKIDISSGRDPSSRKKYLSILQEATDGRVLLEKDRFYLKQSGNQKIEFSLVAEGIRKLALLWQLIKNGTLEKGSILLWDEPEANLNPRYIPVVAEMLLALQRDGVQVFVATHDYFLMKYFEIKRDESDRILYHSFYREPSEVGVQCESHETAGALVHNAIQDTFINMYKEEVRKAME